MTEQAFSLTTLHTYWENYQQRLIATITPLSSEQLALPVASHQAIGELVAHLIGARFWWFHRWMGEDEPPDLVDWGTEQDMREAASLVGALGTTWRMISPALSRWTAADLAQLVPPPATVAAEQSEHTREWIVWHVLEHEIHHGGELSLALGGYGLPGIDI
ncbi:MAG TPA: DinB family protein [Ktedonobacterales bacterium]|nr:DinB family protein [Ktedonobacterales bacterium]